MKKVGIVTIHKSPNYGASLQTFALYEYIRENGAQCEIIDILRPVNDDYIYEKRYSSFRNNPFTLKKRLFDFARKILGRMPKMYTSTVSEERFNSFNKNIVYSKRYCRISDIHKDPPIYDLYISGSDQIWNPSQPYCLEPYFLTFAPKGSTKISFASSIGITELTDVEKIKFKEWLSDYSAISVREKQAKLLLDSFIEKEVKTVADPTFLLDVRKWKDIAIYPKLKQKYIAVFLLANRPDLVNYAIQLSKESGYKLVLMKQNNITASDDYILENDLGPREFLGYLGNASLVLTDSFHCSVFSLLMDAENFYTYIQPGNKRGSRIIDLLSTFGLEDHLLSVDFSESFAKLQSRKINHIEKERIIISEQNRSREFLDKWIK